MANTSTRRKQPARRVAPAGRKASAWRWAGFLGPLLAVIGLVAWNAVSAPPRGQTLVTAPDFTLPATDGSTVSLDSVLAGGDALLYFSMGVGCDGCFAQIPEIEAGLTERNIAFVPIMVDPEPSVASEAGRFGIDVPILIDANRQVSHAYGMLGVYGHSDRPSHSFALVHRDGSVGWVHHYATMYVPADQFFTELDQA